MRTILSTPFLAATLVFTSTALAQDPCGPAVIANASTSDLNAQALGVQEVKQLFLIRHPGANPPARYLGCATVRPQNQNHDDVMMFRWNGPGIAPTVLNPNPAAVFNTTGVDFQLAISPDGLVAVCDTAGTSGNGEPSIAVRSNLSQPFGNLRNLRDTRSGQPLSGYVDPTIALIDGRLKLLFAEQTVRRIKIGDLVTDSNNPAYGDVQGIHTAVEPIPNITNWHSPTPVADTTGVCRALILAAATPNGSDAYYQSAPDARDFQVTVLRPQLLLDDGGDWLANPASVDGTALFADAQMTYGDPMRIDMFAINSVAIPASGGQVVLIARVPEGTTIQNGVITIGVPFANPLDPNNFGLNGIGNLCVNPLFAAALPIQNGEMVLAFNAPGGLTPGAVLSVEPLTVDTSSNTIWLGNMGVIEIR